MSCHGRIQRLALTLALLTGAVARAQTPLGGDLVVAAFPPGIYGEYASQTACDDAGACGVFWQDTHTFPDSNVSDILGTVLSPQGQVLAQPRILVTDNTEPVVRAVGLERGFAVLWDRQLSNGQVSPALQYFDESLVPQGDAITLPFVENGAPENPSTYDVFNTIVRTPSGFALFSTAIDDPFPIFGVFVYFVGRDGSVLRPRQLLDADAGNGSPNSLAGRADGGLVAVYVKSAGRGEQSDIYLRRLAANGKPLGPEQRASTERGVIQSAPVVAMGPDGAFLVAWYKEDKPDSPSVILARRFAANGRPLGPTFQVNNLRLLDQRYPVVAADARGNYFIAWEGFDSAPDADWDIHGRLYRHDGKAVSGEIRLNQDQQFDQRLASVTFAANGTLVATWDSSSVSQKGIQQLVPVVRRFAASPGQEICAIAGSQVSCDLARTGGEMELQVSWDGRPGETILFGDWDGDGRDDTCAYDNGQFRCDVNHDGQATAFESFGQPGDVPLLADVDGDGRADPCVWRAGKLLCDTAHDGKVHYQRTFGPSGGVPLLGDLDGDHKADLCLVTDGQWDCLTHAGKRLHFELGQAGDSFALGDADNDGRADPCLLRNGFLMCNTAHNGGPPNYTLQLDVPAGARLLFGNLDGL